jgi:HlyD family secretion protein
VVERYSVSAPITGRLTRIGLHEGDVVQAGTVLASLASVPIDPRAEAQGRARLASARSLQAEAEARVAQARAASVQADREASRRRELAAAGALSDEQREQADLAGTLRARDVEAAEAAARAAASEVATARAAIVSTTSSDGGTAMTEVRAPVGGRVLRVFESSERIVPAGTPLVEIGDARTLELVLNLLSTDAVAVRPGAPLLITNWGGPDTLRGNVRRVEPAAHTKVSALGVEEQRVDVIGELPAPPPGIGDAYRVDAAIVLSQSADALTVPASALFQLDGRWNVFVVQDGRAELRRVAPGRRGGGQAEVLEGLVSGEKVIRYPSDELVDGGRVRPAPVAISGRGR